MNNQNPAVFLKQPVLHIHDLSPQVSDQDIIAVLHECLRARLRINRTEDHAAPLTGTVEFEKLENAEKAYATLHNCYLSQYDAYLRLSHAADPSADPKPSARVRLIKFLPPDVSPGRLFSIFRPFGPIYRVALNYHHTPDGVPFFSGTAVIEFYTESQASLAQSEMHCSELDRHTIAVEEYDDRRDRSGRGMAIINNSSSPQSKWAQAAPFVPVTPSGPLDFTGRRASEQSSFSDAQPPVSRWANAQTHQQPYLLNPNSSSTSPATSKWASPQTPQQASGPTSPDPSGNPPTTVQKQVDPCNLFIKGLSPEIESGDLFHAFKQFGTIVSARVMKNEATGVSKQFGFVSFTTEEATSHALKAMDGVALGQSANRIVVRLHELKKVKDGRPAKLVPTLSPPPTDYPEQLHHHHHHQQQPHEQISLLAKLQAAESSPAINQPPTADEKTAPDHPTPVPAGQATVEQPQAPPGAPEKENALSVETAVPRVQEAPMNPTASGSRLATSGPGSPGAISGCVSPTTSSVVSSGAAGTERERMTAAVGRLQPAARSAGELEELVALLMALPTRERKLCLFNPQVLASKVAEALEIIQTPDELGPPIPLQPAAPTRARVVADAATPSPVRAAQLGPASIKPGSSVPDLSGPASPSAPPPATPAQEEPEYTTLAQLSALSAKEIIDILLCEPSRVARPLLGDQGTPAWCQKRAETEAWLAKIFALASVHQQKQKIGEKLFKILKTFAVRNAPKLAVDLLDSQDLNALALLMVLFPHILKHKVLGAAPAAKP
ncbi:hypothetical protein PtA15_2A347 [Puccinia triticina]|uniref:RRM domain-containing protein n=1 Tax=Puccinia triticina TaxID=208348 RepID=A0ABY7CA64_9BASI|nr:uncharacterized protein PtA15_2A347 [Puccinia triticina]WAQ82034.1 hypothetical protein PtA15_2A347 [Puccinia triticina]